ncbi:nucleotidyltransferase domain-containing protein [Alphaproteobacteria bacterium]|nr:nucleotidyltransferase domain-containing protein [Alphaproteobacteria bacterium]
MKPIQEFKFFQELCSLEGLDKIWLFGSRARGDYGERSDIDLAIKLSKDNPKQRLFISNIIEEADTLLKIDIIYLNDPLDDRFLALFNNDKVLLFDHEKPLLSHH